LHATGIHKIAWHPIENQLVIAYKNSRLDIIKGDQVTLIDDIQSSNLYSDKTINDLIVYNNNAYLSCNFGIVVIDLLKKEIKSTIFPNNNRQNVKVFQTIVYQNKLFALTENGIWSTTLVQNNSWIVENTMGVSGIKNMFVFKNQLYFNNQQKIYAYQSNIAVTWLFSKGMMVPTGKVLPPQRVNAMLNTFFGLLADSPPEVADTFIKDKTTWLMFTRLALKAATKNPLLLLWIWEMAGTSDLIRWLGVFGDFSLDSFKNLLLARWFPQWLTKMQPQLEKQYPALWLRLLCFRYSLSSCNVVMPKLGS
jgi:hypothetical protein